MKDKNFALGLIRGYHDYLLSYANRDVKTKKMLEDADYMPFLWKHEVAQLIIRGKEEMKEIANTIKKLRKDYNCMEF
jgi:hypothetical protein